MNKNNFLKMFILFSILLLITSCVKNKTYNINYISSYGDLSNVIKEYDGTSDVELPSLYALGYKFLGWYENGEELKKEIKTKVTDDNDKNKISFSISQVIKIIWL